MGRRKGPLDALLETGVKLASRAAETVMSDPRGQEAVARAVGFAQRGRKRVEELQERVMQAAGIPARQDVQDMAKQLARLKRKAREISEQLEAAARSERGSGRRGGDGPADGGTR